MRSVGLANQIKLRTLTECQGKHSMAGLNKKAPGQRARGIQCPLHHAARDFCSISNESNNFTDSMATPLPRKSSYRCQLALQVRNLHY